MNLKRVSLIAVLLLVGIPVAFSILMDTLHFVSPITALGLMTMIVTSILLFGYRVIDDLIAKRRGARVAPDGRERKPYVPDPHEP